MAAPPAGGLNAPSSAPVQIVRYVGIDAQNWPAVAAPASYSDLYTRLVLSSNDVAGSTAAGAGGAKRTYTAENRSWPARLFSGRTDNVSTLVNINVRQPDLAISIPLFSISHASGLKLGNSWNTVYAASNIESPLFRIGPNTNMTIHVTTKVSRDVKSQGTSIAISAVTNAVKIAAPTAAILTTLSKPETTNAANAIDKAISALLSEDIGEEVDVGRLASTWAPNASVELDGCSPFIRVTEPPSASLCPTDIDVDGGRDSLVGSWHLTFACPRLSVFDEKDICTSNESSIDPNVYPDPTKLMGQRQAIARRVSDAQIMSFPLSTQTTVQAYVLSQPWFTSFVAISSKKAPDYATFCASAIGALEISGLNTLDSSLVLRAMIRLAPQLQPLGTEFARGGKGETCLRQISQNGA